MSVDGPGRGSTETVCFPLIQARERRPALQGDAGQRPFLPVGREVHLPQQDGGVLQERVHLQDQGDLPQRRHLERQEPPVGPVGKRRRRFAAPS